MAKVITILESEIKQKNGKDYQRVIFSDNKIAYVNLNTGDVDPSDLSEKYIDLITLYNAKNGARIKPTENKKVMSLRKTAVWFDIFTIVALCLTFPLIFTNNNIVFFCLFWVIPITLITSQIIKDGRKHPILAVLTLIFVNFISGILLIMSDSELDKK